MLQIDDITTLQGKPFDDLVAYLAASIKPKSAFLAGVSNAAVNNLVRYDRESETTVHRETTKETYDRPDGKGGTVPMEVSFTNKTLDRKFNGPCLLTKLFLTQVPEDGEVTKIVKESGVLTEFLTVDAGKQLVERATGEGHEDDPKYVTDLEDLELDLIAIDMRRYNGDAIGLILNQLDMFFGGALVITGLKNREQMLWNLMQRYAGACIFVLSAVEDGTLILFREEAVL